MDVRRAVQKATFLVATLLVGLGLWAKPVLADEPIGQRIAEEARALIGTAPYASDPSDCDQNPCNGWMVCTDVVVVATERAGAPISEDSCACTVMRRAEYQRSFFQGSSVEGANNSFKRHYEPSGSKTPPAKGNILLFSDHVGVVVEVNPYAEGKMTLTTVETRGGTAAENIGYREYILVVKNRGWYFVSGHRYTAILGWGVIDESLPLPQQSLRTQVGDAVDRWWPAVTIIAAVVAVVALIVTNPAAAAAVGSAIATGISTVVSWVAKAGMWVLNRTLELLRKLMTYLEQTAEQKLRGRLRRRRFRPWRAGAIAAIELAAGAFVLACIVTLVAGVAPGGIPLEAIVGGRENWIARLVSIVSQVDPFKVAYGLMPARELRQEDQEVLATSVLPTFQITYWNGDNVQFHAPATVWDAVRDAVEEHGGDPLLVVAVAHSESPSYNNTAVSSAGAQGIWQFMPGTWEQYKPTESAQRTDIEAAAEAATEMINDLRLAEQQSESSFIRRFTGADGGQVWNAHAGQARYVWRLWQELHEETE